VSDIGFGQRDAKTAQIVIERLKLAQQVRLPRAADLFADFFGKSHRVRQ
jgi:hypothetical protein